MFSGRRAGAARRARATREATNTSVDQMGSQEVEDEVFFQDERDSDEEEGRRNEVEPFPSTPNPVFGMNQRSAEAEAEAGLLDDEEDEEIELMSRARAALVEPKARHELFKEANPAGEMLAFFAAKRAALGEADRDRRYYTTDQRDGARQASSSRGDERIDMWLQEWKLMLGSKLRLEM